MPGVTADILQVHPFRDRNGAREHLVLRRADSDELCPGIWQVVTGTVHEGESTRAAAERELVEEIGTGAIRWHQFTSVATFYFAPLDAVVLSPILACEIHPDAEIRLSEEHSDFEWLPANEAIGRLEFDAQKEGLDMVERLASAAGGEA